MKYRGVLDEPHRSLVRQLKSMERQRTPGKWNIDEMEFPHGDPDRAFVEFCSEHAATLIAIIESKYWVE